MELVVFISIPYMENGLGETFLTPKVYYGFGEAEFGEEKIFCTTFVPFLFFLYILSPFITILPHPYKKD